VIIIASILLFLSSLVIAFQDFKHRSVDLWAFILVLISLIVLNYPNNLDYWILNSSINILLILIQLLCSSIFISIRNKKITNIWNVYIGIGDILLLLILSLTFSMPVFLFFTLIAYLLSICYALTIKIITQKETSIPLAGNMAILLIGLILIKHTFHFNNLYDMDNLTAFLSETLCQ